MFQTYGYANRMPKPIRRETLSMPFVNQYVDVVHEDLFIKIDSTFNNATFNVNYYINSSKDGFQIPFLFYASEYLDFFSVKIDGIEVRIKDIPADLKVPENTKFKDFSYLFEYRYNGDRSIVINESSHNWFSIRLSDMIYFETNISKGKHIIEVNYIASNWADFTKPLKEYSFRYALTPAKYWKSFGTLSIKVDATDFEHELKSNLGQTTKGDLKSIAEWKFDKLPTDILEINYKPSVSVIAQLLLYINTVRLMIITGVILAIAHLMLVIRYRKKKPLKHYSLVVILGSVLVPLLFLMSLMFYSYLIALAIGEHASGRYGNYFFALLYYPEIMPVYWFVYWLIDRQIKKKYTR